MQILKKKTNVGLENHMSNWQISARGHKILKIVTFIGSFYTKEKMYELKT